MIALPSWTNPHGVDMFRPFFYYISVTDRDGCEYRYIGRARDESHLVEYVRDVDRIFMGIPKGVAQRYRAVHLALAKACQFDWRYEFHPLENIEGAATRAREQELRHEYDCNLNDAGTWSVADFHWQAVGSLLKRA